MEFMYRSGKLCMVRQVDEKLQKHVLIRMNNNTDQYKMACREMFWPKRNEGPPNFTQCYRAA